MKSEDKLIIFRIYSLLWDGVILHAWIHNDGWTQFIGWGWLILAIYSGIDTIRIQRNKSSLWQHPVRISHRKNNIFETIKAGV